MPDALRQAPAMSQAPAEPDLPDTVAAPSRRLKVVQLTDRVGTHGGAEG